MDISEDIVTRKFSGMSFDEVLEYLVQEVKDRNYLIAEAGGPTVSGHWPEPTSLYQPAGGPVP